MEYDSQRAVRWFSVAAAICFSVSCVPLSDYSIDGAPCPCPIGYRCCRGTCQKNAMSCDTLDSVFGADSETSSAADTGSDTGSDTDVDTGTDTGTEPPTDTTPKDTSSEPKPCETNSQCNGGEVCLSWLALENHLMGPKICRPTCFSSNECNEGEVCELSLSDGKPMEERRLSLACLDSSGFAGCEPSSCRTCLGELEGSGMEIPTDMSIELMICSENNDALIGCFAALDGTCGLYCTKESIMDCTCAVSDGSAYCDDMIDANYSDIWCAEYSCNQCEARAGQVSCVNSEKKMCMSVPLTSAACNGDCVCNEICIEQDMGACK